MVCKVHSIKLITQQGKHMDNERKFWLILWTLASVVTIVGVGVIASTTHYRAENALIADLIQKGHDPVSVSCAFEDEYGTHPTCIINASKVKSDDNP